jgi:hypothetical protein
MKLTTRILLGLFILMIAGLLVSNMVLKKQYNAIDKSDLYWTYNKVLEKPFKHLNITGGNGTNIFFEQSNKPSVRLSQEWVAYHHGSIKAEIRNDTLFLVFNYMPANLFEKFYLQNAAPVRIFSPELLSVTGVNTNFEMQRLKQRNITVNISGRSKFEVESMFPEMDSIDVTQSDSSAVVFEMSPDYRKHSAPNQQEEKIAFHNAEDMEVAHKDPKDAFDEAMSFNAVTAKISGHSILDIGHAQVKNFSLNVSDSSAIVLSGTALRLTKQH